MRQNVEREAVFNSRFLEDLWFWILNNRKTALRILDLIEQTIRDPFHGAGKLEPLRFDLAGSWSRRITQEHRLVYYVFAKRIDFLQARYHY